jgi:hypothetical protein
MGTPDATSNNVVLRKPRNHLNNETPIALKSRPDKAAR